MIIFAEILENHPVVFLFIFYFFNPIQQIHTYLTNTLGIPSWGSYVIFAIVTLFLGLLLGLVSNHYLNPACLKNGYDCMVLLYSESAKC